MTRGVTNTLDDLWKYVEKTDGCWLWTGSTRTGYGVFNCRYRRIPAHRVAYELLVGPIPDGMVIDHLCRVRSCVNPAHLEPVTNRENLLRGVGFSAIHAKKTHCVNGHLLDEPNTHITPKGARKCRACDRINSRKRWLKKKETANG